MTTAAFSAVCVWHIVAISVCVLYLIGKPVALTLPPLIPRADTRALVRRTSDRSPTQVADYCRKRCSQTGISLDIPDRVRNVLKAMCCPYADRIMPLDRVYLLDGDIDLTDVLFVLGKEFGTRFSKDDYPRVDGTFDNLRASFTIELCRQPEPVNHHRGSKFDLQMVI